MAVLIEFRSGAFIAPPRILDSKSKLEMLRRAFRITGKLMVLQLFNFFKILNLGHLSLINSLILNSES